jgi:hypothetical protein
VKRDLGSGVLSESDELVDSLGQPFFEDAPQHRRQNKRGWPFRHDPKGLAYLITALQAVLPGVGTSALQLLQSAQPPIETVLTTVLNELSGVPNDVYLVRPSRPLATLG